MTGVRRVTSGSSGFAVVLGVAALLLAGCSTAGGEEPVGLATPTSTPTASPTPSPTPSALGPVDRSNAELGIVFTSLPSVPEDTPEAADLRAAIDTYTGFEQEFWRTLTSGEMALPISGLADEGVASYVQYQLDMSEGVRSGGTASFAVSPVSHDSTTTVLDSCQDFTAATSIAPDGTVTPASPDERFRFTVTMGRDARGEWIVTGYEKAGTC